MRYRYYIYILLTVLLPVVSSCGSSRNVVASRTSNDGRGVNRRPSGSDVMPIPDDKNHPSAILLAEARKWLGTRYRYGGHSKDGTDCSGMVMEVFNSSAGIKLPRNSREQHKYCKSISAGDLMPGDLVFFANNLRTGRIGHVGLYVGDGMMIHASTSKGVIVSGLDEDYWKKHYAASGRVADFEKMVDRYQKDQGRKGQKRSENTKKKSSGGRDRRAKPSRIQDTPPAASVASPATGPSVVPSESPQWFD